MIPTWTRVIRTNKRLDFQQSFRLILLCFVLFGWSFGVSALDSIEGIGIESPASLTTAINEQVVNDPPVISCANISVNTDPGMCGAIVTFTPVVTDDSPGVTISCIPASGSFFAANGDGLPTMVTCTATDVGGLTAICTFAVDVSDEELPQVTCVPTFDAALNENGLFNFTGQLLTDEVVVTSSDNCGVVANFFQSNSGMINCLDIGTAPIQWAVKDVYQNLSEFCEVALTVSDPGSVCSVPVAVCQELIVLADENGLGYADHADFDGGSYDPKGAALQFYGFPPAPYPLGVTEVELYVYNGEWNITCLTSITVVEPPSIICPSNMTLVADDNCEAVYSGPGVECVPNCGGVTITSLPELPATFIGQGVHPIVYQMTGAGGFSITCTQEITVVSSILADAGPDRSVIINTGSGPVPQPCVDILAAGAGVVGVYNYSWSPGTDLSDPNVATPIACPTADTDYILTVSNAGGCNETDTMTVFALDINDADLPYINMNSNKVYVCHMATCETVELNVNASCNSPSSLCQHMNHGDLIGPCECRLGNSANTANSELVSLLTAYPNPVMDELTLHSVEGIPIERIEVFDLQGKLILREDPLGQESGHYHLKLATLPAGLYVLRVMMGGEDQIIRLEKE